MAAPKKTTEQVRTKQIFVPRANPGEENFIVIGINGKTWKIKKGVPVTVPYYVKEAYDNSLKASSAAYDYVDGLAEKNRE